MGRSGGVSPENEHGGDKRRGGVRGGEGLEERDAGLGIAVDQYRDLVRPESSWVPQCRRIARIGGQGSERERRLEEEDEEEGEEECLDC